MITLLLWAVHSLAKAWPASPQGHQAWQPRTRSPCCPCRTPLAPTCPPLQPQHWWYWQRPVLQTSWTWKQSAQKELSSWNWCRCALPGLCNTSQGTRTLPQPPCLPLWTPTPGWRGHSSTWSRNIPREHVFSLKDQLAARFSSGHEQSSPAGLNSSGQRTQQQPCWHRGLNWFSWC